MGFGILIIEFAKDLRAQGKPLIEAAVEAAHLRFRPILMTGFAFVFGVAPMVVAAGASGKSQQALGTGVMGGMIAVVVLALIMVPAFFVAVQKLFTRRAEASPVRLRRSSPPKPRTRRSSTAR
jgi:multidrug efflux pump